MYHGNKYVTRLALQWMVVKTLPIGEGLLLIGEDTHLIGESFLQSGVRPHPSVYFGLRCLKLRQLIKDVKR